MAEAVLPAPTDLPCQRQTCRTSTAEDFQAAETLSSLVLRIHSTRSTSQLARQLPMFERLAKRQLADFSRSERVQQALHAHAQLRRRALSNSNRSHTASLSTDLAQLTPRQLQVLAWITAGATDARIAEALGIAAKTVGKHVEHILTRLGVENRSSAAALLRSFRCESPACRSQTMPPAQTTLSPHE